MPNTSIQIIGVLFATAGVWLLRQAWFDKAKNTYRLIAGWGFILGCIVAWGFTSGPDKGPALGITAAVLVALCALTFQAFRAEVRPRRDVRERVLERRKLSAGDYFSRIWTGLLMGPIAGLSALAVCTAAFSILKSVNVEHTLNLTLVSFAFPMTWGGLAVFAGYSTKRLAKTAVLLISGVAPLIYIIASA